MSYKLGNLENDFDYNLYKINYNRNLSTIDIVKIECSKEEYVYNIEVDDNNNYLVENI